MRHTVTLSDELIAKIGAGIDELPVVPKPRQQLTTLLGRLDEQIRSAQTRGASFAEIAQQITTNGYPIKPGTLRAGIARHRRKTIGVKLPSATARSGRRRTPSNAASE